MNNVKTFNEGSLILVLLSLTLFFNFWVVPFGVADPENFGYEDGLAPSFAVYLVGILAFVTLMYQFIKVFIFISVLQPKLKLQQQIHNQML